MLNFRHFAALVAASILSLAGVSASAQQFSLVLSGANEVPPVNTQATGRAEVTVGADLSVVVRVTTSGITPTAAHIHQAAATANGPVIVPFVKTGDNSFSEAPGSKLTPAQLDALKAGNLYVNVHSAANPGGEIRAQIR